MNASVLSYYFIKRASEVDENDLTNLKLQKLLYFAQGEYCKITGDPLFSESIEAWDLGPVVRDVYNQFKTCGSFPITVFDLPSPEIKLEEEQANFLDQIWENYGKFSAAFLVNLTHKENTPWAKFYKKGSNNIIPLDDLKAYFSEKSML